MNIRTNLTKQKHFLNAKLKEVEQKISEKKSEASKIKEEYLQLVDVKEEIKASIEDIRNKLK